MTSQPPASCWMMGGAQDWPPTRTLGARSGATVRPGLRPETMRVMGGTTPVTFAVIRSWVLKWQKFSINILIGGINVQEIGRTKASMPWLMAPQGSQRPYEDQPARLQGWGHKGCHHTPKLVLGRNSILTCSVPRLHPSPLCHPFLTRLAGGVGEEFGDGHHPGWSPHHTRWTL